MAKTVADQFVETLAAAGVKRIYGIVGDSLNGLTDAVRRHGKIEWLHVRHEEVAAFAAGAEAHLTGELAVCAGSCGPGNLHLINGLFDCHRSRVPVLGIAAHIPSPGIGSGYFQETQPQTIFQECSHYCEFISTPHQMPRVLEVAIREAVGHFITLMKPRGTPKINMSAMWSCRIHRHSRLTTSQNPGFGDGLIYAAASPRTRSCRGVRIHLTLHQQGFGPHQLPNREACDGGYDEADNDGRSTCRPGPRVRCWFLGRQRLALRRSARSRFVHFESNCVAQYREF